MEPAEVVGRALRTDRRRKGRTVEAAAEAAGISHVTWRRLERGDSVRDQTLTKLEELFDLEYGVLSRAVEDMTVAKLIADRINGVASAGAQGRAMTRVTGGDFDASLIDSPELQAEAHAWDVPVDQETDDPPETEIIHQWDTPTRVLARRLRDVRTRRGRTIRQVAGDCFRIGQRTLTPEAIQAIEAGERGAVSVDEVFALGYALDVAPVNLLVPLEPRDDVHDHRYWIAPDISMTVAQAREWVRGNREWLRGRLPAAPGVDPIAYLRETPPREWVPKERSAEEMDEYSDMICRYRHGRDLLQPPERLLPGAVGDYVSAPDPDRSAQELVNAAQRNQRNQEDDAVYVALKTSAKIDRAYESMSVAEIADAPVSALVGVSEGDARHLKEAFGITTVRDLGTNKYFLWAQALTTLAD